MRIRTTRGAETTTEGIKLYAKNNHYKKGGSGGEYFDSALYSYPPRLHRIIPGTLTVMCIDLGRQVSADLLRAGDREVSFTWSRVRKVSLLATRLWSCLFYSYSSCSSDGVGVIFRLEEEEDDGDSLFNGDLPGLVLKVDGYTMFLLPGMNSNA